MYKNKQAVSGGTAPRQKPEGPTLGFRTRIRPTGTKKGWSAAPYPKLDISGQEEKNKFTLKDILDTNTDEEHLENLRNLISMIHKEQNI